MDLKQQITLLTKFDKKYLIDCLDKHGYILKVLKVKRILNQSIDPKLLCKYLVETSYSEQQRKELQQVVEDEMTKRLGKMFKTINNADLDYLFKRIDYLFCGDSLQRLDPPPVAKCMEPEHRKTSEGTLGSFELRTNTIRINTKLLLESMENKVHEVCNGVVCKSRVSVLLSVVEHEIVHMIVSNSCWEMQSHGKNFMTIAKKIFGHTLYRHSLGREVSLVGDRVLTKQDLSIHERVSFHGLDKLKNDVIYYGIILKLNRINAIVKTETGDFNVPFHYLSKN